MDTNCHGKSQSGSHYSEASISFATDFGTTAAIMLIEESPLM